MSMRMEMDRHGWAFLHLDHPPEGIVITLSGALHDPMPDLARWIAQALTRRAVAEFRIDEEGPQVLWGTGAVDRFGRAVLHIERMPYGDEPGFVLLRTCDLVATAEQLRLSWVASMTDPAQLKGWQEWFGEYDHLRRDDFEEECYQAARSARLQFLHFLRELSVNR